MTKPTEKKSPWEKYGFIIAVLALAVTTFGVYWTIWTATIPWNDKLFALFALTGLLGFVYLLISNFMINKEISDLKIEVAKLPRK